MQPILTLSGHDPEPHVTDIGGKETHGQLLDWMASLPLDDYPAIKAFTETNSYRPTDELFDQVARALIAFPPAADGTNAAVDLFLDRMGGGYPDETVSIEN